VRTAADGAEALASLGSGTDAIGLVLLDLRMPGMDGFELCRRVDRLPEVAVPVIVMTAEHETRGIAGSRCVVAVVHKPLDLLRLEALVEEHLAV
jgi:CheY-like chemotaxis protein